jgi:5-formyltetrahydrofolate cyclo-ligase
VRRPGHGALRHARTVRRHRTALPGDKSALRRVVLARRAALAPAALAAAGEALAAALRPVCAGATAVAAYAAVGAEPPTGALLDGLRGVRLLLPVLLPDGDLDWSEHRPGDALATGAHGLLEPAGPRLGRDAVAGCDVVVVPALAVDRSGRRLGRGGGAYDRALPRARGLVVALLHDGELLDTVPAEPHDVAVSAVATPSGGLLRLTPGRMGP